MYTQEERKELIEKYGNSFNDLLKCLEDIPKEMWQFKPEPKEWSVHEILVHLADSETMSAQRARKLIAEPNQPIMRYNQDNWANRLNYHDQSWEEALKGIEWARNSTLQLIKDLPEETWGNSVIHPHPKYDDPFTFDVWLRIYSGHIYGHIDQINTNHKIWMEKQNA